MKVTAPIAIAVGFGLGLGAGAGVFFQRSRVKPPVMMHVATPRTLVVPRARGDVKIDGETNDPAWLAGNIARTGAFGARPYSDSRLIWKGSTLYMVLYAADEDLRTTPNAKHDDPLWLADYYRVTFARDGRESTIEVSPAGVLSDYRRERDGTIDRSWESHATLAVDLDGTLNDSHDNDEEWVVEMALPLESIELEARPGERIGMSIERCDLSRGSKKRTCATWGREGAEIVLGD